MKGTNAANVGAQSKSPLPKFGSPPSIKPPAIQSQFCCCCQGPPGEVGEPGEEGNFGRKFVNIFTIFKGKMGKMEHRERLENLDVMER
jgi:hypothetical protein